MREMGMKISALGTGWIRMTAGSARKGGVDWYCSSMGSE
jgi:hypothetical protein